MNDIDLQQEIEQQKERELFRKICLFIDLRIKMTQIKLKIQGLVTFQQGLIILEKVSQL